MRISQPTAFAPLGLPRWLAYVVALAAIVSPAASRAQDAAPANGVAVSAEATESRAEVDGPAERQVGYVRVPMPLVGDADVITDGRLQRALARLTAQPEAASEDAPVGRPTLVIEFRAAPDEEPSEFERALRVARRLLSPEFARVRTVAYVPRTLSGHAVLAALACEEIAMAPDAQLGDAGAADDAAPLPLGVAAAYREVAETRRTLPPAVARAMVQRSIELVRVETEAGDRYVEPEGLEALRGELSIVSESVVSPSGSLVTFTGREMREAGFAKYLVRDSEALARVMGVSPDVWLLEQALAESWRPVMVDLNGPVTDRAARRLKTLVGDQLERENVNWIGVRIDSAGGDTSAALRLAQTLAELGGDEVRTVAYVPRRAEGPAAVVALACDQLVMQAGAKLVGNEPPDDGDAAGDDPGRRLGEQPADDEALDEGEAEDDPIEGEAVDGADNRVIGRREAIAVTVREALGPSTGRPWSLPLSAIDGSIAVSQYRNRQTGERRALSPEELETLSDAADWRAGEVIKPAGEALSLDADRAAEFGVAWRVVDRFEDLTALYGFTESPPTAAPNWALELVEALASPGLAALLLVIGVVGLYVELNTPGVGLGGFVATVALLLFFWSKFLDGTADWLEVMLFVTGVVFVLIELILLPGFGVFGLGGSLLVIASLVLASQTFILPKTDSQLLELRNSLATVVGAGVGCLAIGITLRQLLPQASFFRRATLAPMDEADRIEQGRREQLADYEHLVGRSGQATTDLLPTGRAEIDGELVDVQTRGEPIDRGAGVVVVSASANRVVVRQASG